jgi:photosystem II stability/assembly factor-like uncharacterized protein
MKTIFKFHGLSGLLMLGLACSALAQSTNSELLPSAPYRWRNVIMGGGGFVTGIIFHPTQKNLFYARTDVGGAYRWDDAQKKWIPLTDWLPTTDFTGIESLALDATDTNRVYLAAGIYRSARAAILRSDDQGRTWQQTEVPFKMGGNETGRFNGERLAVDPNDGEILFFGSRHDGLWKSSDRGVTWSNVPSFPKIDTTETPPTATRTNANRRFRGNFTPQQTGIVFVQFDSRSSSTGQPTPVIYVGVSTVGTNFFQSVDGGRNWEPVAGQPLGLRPNHAVLAEDGMLFLTYGKQPGPTSMSDGAVWKFNPKTGAWANITPATVTEENQPFGYGAVSVDAKNSSNIVVTTFAHWHPHDEIFRSTNGGVSWTRLLENAKWNYSSAPYTQKRTPHWMGTIQIDPLDSNHVLFTTGYGIWACGNLTDADSGRPTRWAFFDDGLEETVPLALISPPSGAHLLSGVGDIDGFRHDDVNVSPAEGNFRGPRFSNTEDLAFAGQNPAVIVRSGSGGNAGVHAAISTDGGKSWNALASDPAESSGGAGSITISADGKIIVWTPRRAAANFSSDNGKNWTPCAGLNSGIRVVADPVNPTRFYAFDSQGGKLFVSTNGAANFSMTEATLPATQGFNAGTLSVAPDREGDLWLAMREGVFRSTNAETFMKLKNVQSAHSIGFGMAGRGEKFPALFLTGKINDVSGIFRSDDGGNNWTRINDDQHQYGSISHITGDPRIYGRVYFATTGRGVVYGDPAVETK